jgi:two-component system chemotaxis response regulator CheB
MAFVSNEPSRPAVDGLPGPYRVMVVDDSVVVRGLIARALESDPEIEVVASVSNGQQAVSAVGRYKVDVVVLDIEMPKMDGMAALPLLLKVDPRLKVIMISTPSRRSADLSLRALAEGAADYVTKPSTTRDLVSARDFQRDLVDKVKALAATRRGGSGRVSARVAQPELAAGARARLLGAGPIALRKPGYRRPELLAIASSTGGPQALTAVLTGLGRDFHLPILVTQHMPPNFTAILADRLGRASGRPCKEAEDGEPVLHGYSYIAPGDSHMLIEWRGAKRVIKLDDGPPENFCRPAADPMLRSIARVCEGRALAVVLTGMGQDGTRGARMLVEAGGTVFAQDEATSVVWGMPGAVAAAGLCSAVLPLNDIAGQVNRLVSPEGGKG